MMTRRDYALYATAVFCWGTSWIALRVQAVSVEPVIAVFWRFVFATILMFLWALLRKDNLRFDLKTHGFFVTLGMCLFSWNFLGTYYGSRAIPSGLVAVIFSLASVSNILLGAILLGQRITARLLGGAIIGITGVALMFSGELQKAASSDALMVGLAFCIFGTFCFSLGNIVSSRVSAKGINVISASAWGMVYGTVSTGIIALVLGQSFAVPLTPAFIGSLVWVVTSATIVAVAAYFTLVQSIGPARAGYATVMFPVVALLISTFAETWVPGAGQNFQWSAAALLGMAMTIGGNLLVLRK
ncbi:MAG: DMT family transporter [Beijerinckiaceae bacterium]